MQSLFSIRENIMEVTEQKNSEERTITLRKRLEDRRLRIVASRIGMTYAALSRIMRGGKPSQRTIERLEKYLEG